MRILLADEGEMTRFALAALLEQRSGWVVVGEVATAGKLLPKIKTSNPDLILLNWNLPGLMVEDMIATISANCPGISVIILSGRPEMRSRAISAGATGFVSKVDPPNRLLEAITAVEMMPQD